MATFAATGRCVQTALIAVVRVPRHCYSRASSALLGASCAADRHPAGASRTKRNAPSRCRLRPASRLTAAEATATRRTFNLGRSVLGACGTLWLPTRAVKTRLEPTCRKLRLFLFTQAKLRIARACSSDLERESAAGPEGPTADSPSRERFRPPSRRTFRFRVVLLGGLRPTGAPCSAQAGHYAPRTGPTRASSKEIPRYLRSKLSAKRTSGGGRANRDVPPTPTTDPAAGRATDHGLPQ